MLGRTCRLGEVFNGYIGDMLQMSFRWSLFERTIMAEVHWCKENVSNVVVKYRMPNNARLVICMIKCRNLFLPLDIVP